MYNVNLSAFNINFVFDINFSEIIKTILKTIYLIKLVLKSTWFTIQNHGNAVESHLHVLYSCKGGNMDL